MEIYTEIQTFKISKVQKETLQKLKSQKVNVSKFIRDAVKEKIEREKLVKKDNRRKGFFAKQMVQCSILLNGWLNEDVELNDGQDEKIIG